MPRKPLVIRNKPRKPSAGPSPWAGHAALRERPYSDDEGEFLRAVEALRVARGRPFLSATDYLEIAIGLGYRKPGG